MHTTDRVCPMQIADSFRRFGITDQTTELIAVKVAKVLDLSSEDVSRHLDQVIKGTPMIFDDVNLRRFTDLEKTRKSYKLSSSREEISKRLPREARIQQPSNVTDYEMKELEATILGLMALRGAT